MLKVLKYNFFNGVVIQLDSFQIREWFRYFILRISINRVVRIRSCHSYRISYHSFAKSFIIISYLHLKTIKIKQFYRQI
jgi:hypothetical protein